MAARVACACAVDRRSRVEIPLKKEVHVNQLLYNGMLVRLYSALGPAVPYSTLARVQPYQLPETGFFRIFRAIVFNYAPPGHLLTHSLALGKEFAISINKSSEEENLASFIAE